MMYNFSEILSKLWTNEISQEALILKYNNTFTEQDIIAALENAYFSKSAKESESVFHVAFMFDLFTKKSIPILGKFISQIWHNQHENIASILQQLKDANSVSYLMEGIHIKCDYWYDDGDAFIRKCLYALAAVNTLEAKEKIAILANDSNEIISKYALAYINKVHS